MADSVDPAVAAKALADAQHFIFVTQIHFCAMYAVVIWDWLVSIPREWRYIWRSGWTAAKISYLFCRYWVIFAMPYVLYVYASNEHTMEECQKIYRAPVALAMWNQAGAEVVLLIRTYAFFNRNFYLLMALCCGLASVLAYQLYVDVSQMLILPFVIPPFEKGPCLPMSKPGSAHILGFFLASLAFDATVTSMTLWKAFKLRRISGAPSSPLIQTFLREGVFYFIFISVANLINGIFYLQPKAVMSAINIPLSVMFADILACRMILDLRERGYEISQPTIQAPEYPGMNILPGGTTATMCSSATPRSKTVVSPTPMVYRSGMPSSSKGSGIRSFFGGRGNARAPTPAMTTTLDSCVLTTQGDLEVSSQQEEGSLEMRNFAPHLEDEKQEIEMGDHIPAYHVVDMGMPGHPPPTGIRIDVEKTVM